MYMNLSYQYRSRFLYHNGGIPGKLSGVLYSPSWDPRVYTAQLGECVLDFMQILPQATFAFLFINNLYLTCLALLNYKYKSQE